MTETSSETTSSSHDNPSSSHGDGDSGPGKYSQEHGAGGSSNDDAHGGNDSVRVLDPNKAEALRGRWNEVQAGFVDEPKESVNGADQLVGEVLDEVSRVFKEQRSELEKAWSGGESEQGTEELRQALQRYREFFDRLLSL